MKLAALVRKKEFSLIVISFIFLLINAITLFIIRDYKIITFLPLAVWSICAVTLHLFLEWMIPERDPLILPVIFLMAGWGLLLVDRLAPVMLLKQSLWLVIASAGLTLMAALPRNLRVLSEYKYIWLICGIILLFLTLVVGVNPSGDPYAPRLWLGYGGLYLQPSELLKLLMIIYLAGYLSDHQDHFKSDETDLNEWSLPSIEYLSPMLFMWGLCMILLVWQRDLGAAFLFFIIFISLLYLTTGQLIFLIVGFISLIGISALGYWLYDVVKLRFDIFINPWIDPSGNAYQIVQSLIAIASGNLLGEGIGQGAPLYVPVVHSDFVYAAISEEWGLLGSAGLVLLFGLLFIRGVTIAIKNDLRRFHALLALGLSVSIAIQALMIMGGILKLLPLTGVTLPFISYGGSSLVVSFMMIGLLLRISDQNSKSLVLTGIQKALKAVD